jgi:hypothetical protein
MHEERLSYITLMRSTKQGEDMEKWYIVQNSFTWRRRELLHWEELKNNEIHMEKDTFLDKFWTRRD